MFRPHPSRLLNEHFAAKPYQGAQPEAARFIFIGLDANYADDIEQSPIFQNLVAYHQNGPRFPQTNGTDYPFLLSEYKGDGRRYHLNFAKIGFTPQHAELVSFIELMDVPTVGRSQLTQQDLPRRHLERLRKAIFHGDANFVFLSAGVQRLMVSTGLFPEILQVRRNFGALRVLYEGDNRAVFLHLHLSNYGKFEQQRRAEANEIAGLLAHVDA